MRRALAPLVLIALVATACGESDGVNLPGGDATTTSVTASGSALGSTTTSEPASTSTTIDDGTPTTESSDTVAPATSTVTTDSGRTPATVPDTTIPPTTGEGPAELVDQIIADAAGRAGVTSSDVTVIRSEAVVWNDGSLGCPEPGVMYTQALVDGFWVVVSVAGTEYDYRATANGNFKLCARPPAGGTVVDR